MRSSEILTEAARRPLEAALALRESLTPEAINAHPGGHDNSIAWLLWHTGREIDAQTAALSGDEQVWEQRGFDRRFGLGELGAGIGYGHSPDQARALVVDDAELLLEYLAAATDALVSYINELEDAQLGEVIDDSYDPPITRGVRLVSIIDDASQHIGQAAYASGMLR
ncbi:MAG TPA: DinB family protein [Candidatus Agrococcus pullicola]|uniref:DinB family protein n=1 Tax=Candidatus Agrococcus pullicola TaxID=2838429 RepID=A0A9D2C8T7_9MICO|nr:DinB family protein [Candidatus Agrococcus pullicola]